jgi:hypothetical protein
MIEMKKTFFILDQPKKHGNCKYKAICSLYSNSSYTCTHTGGGYCGKYRKLSGKPATESNIQTVTA